MITISLKDFVLNGNFGPVKIGITRDDVVNLLGEPEGEGDFGSGYGGLQYARYEFFYDKKNKGRIYAMQNDNLAIFPNLKTKRVNNKYAICFSNDHVTIDIWFLKKGRYLTYKDVVEILKKEKINYEVIEKQGVPIFKFASGVEMDFYDNSGTLYYSDDWKGSREQPTPILDRNDWILNGIRLFEH
jgi:hypothetical protein